VVMAKLHKLDILPSLLMSCWKPRSARLKHLEGRGIITGFPHFTRFFSLKGFTGGTPVIPYNEASRMTPNAKVLNL
jgi:hypothetical protein